MPQDRKNIIMEGVRIIFRNFAGKEGQYNREGDRNFSVILDEDVADDLFKAGMNVKRLKPREEEGEEVGSPYLPVAVNFKGRPPNIFMITTRGRTRLGEDEVELLDWADITNVDMIINPYEWTVGDKGGVKAYLESMYVTIEEDQLAQKYGDIPEVSARAGRIQE
jgi:hypothetical protein